MSKRGTSDTQSQGTANNLRCLKHRDYMGATGPTLSCSTCCSIYINRVQIDKVEREIPIVTREVDKQGRPKEAIEQAKKANKNVLMSYRIKH